MFGTSFLEDFPKCSQTDHFHDFLFHKLGVAAHRTLERAIAKFDTPFLEPLYVPHVEPGCGAVRLFSLNLLTVYVPCVKSNCMFDCTVGKYRSKWVELCHLSLTAIEFRTMERTTRPGLSCEILDSMSDVHFTKGFRLLDVFLG